MKKDHNEPKVVETFIRDTPSIRYRIENYDNLKQRYEKQKLEIIEFRRNNKELVEMITKLEIKIRFLEDDIGMN